MKKIVFGLKGMYLGGTEKALLTALNNFPQTDYEVTILLLDKEGALLDKIPSFCKVLYIENIDNKAKEPLLRNGFVDNIKYYLKHFRLIKVIKLLFRRIIKKDLLAEADGLYPKIPHLEEEFDIAVSGQYHDTFITRFIADHVTAKKKYVWVHNDLKTTGYRYQYTKSYINNFDKIYAVSKTIEEELKDAYPEIANRIETKYNYFDEKTIKEKSLENIELPWSKDTFSILSVGRLDKQKGFDIAIEAAGILKKSGISFTWYVLGDGMEKQNLIKLIYSKKLENQFVLLGSVNNPFPYMKGCSLYVQPSRHEGYCTTTMEALCLNKPVIMTKVSGAEEQIKDDFNGWLVDIDATTIANKIIEVYKNPSLLKEITNNIAKKAIDHNATYFDFLD